MRFKYSFIHVPLAFALVRQRGFSAMATPNYSYQLRRDVFNDELYTRMHELWFRGQADAKEPPNMNLMRRWFAVGLSTHEKAALDGECDSIAGPALRSIAPSEINLPSYKDYQDDLEHASEISGPLMDVVKKAQQDSVKKGADTLLSLVLLLDQMPRNIWRKQENLPLVYNHYDRLAWTLIRNMLSTSPELFEQPTLANRKYWMWFLLPMVHSEDIESHKLARKLELQWRARADEPEEGPAAEFARKHVQSIEEHAVPVQRFGRYPHRNTCLGRGNTEEERKYLETADTFGVEQTAPEQARDEL